MDNNIINDRKKQDDFLMKMILFLCDWMDDNEGNLRSSIVDSINYNIAYVEVWWFNENPTSLHDSIISEGRKVSTDMNFEEAFKTLQSSFDNIIFEVQVSSKVKFHQIFYSSQENQEAVDGATVWGDINDYLK